MIPGLLLQALLAYVLGSVSGSLLIGRLRGVDIRQAGSGNAGGTNALRTQGLAFALGVVVVDVGKGALAVALLPTLPPGAAPLPWAQATCGLAAMIGHVYPVFHGFRGGKGAATFVGGAWVLLPAALAPVVGLWTVVIVLTGYVGLATILAALFFAFCCVWLGSPLAWDALLPFGFLGAALIVFTHRSNLRRLLAGTENRFEKVRVVNWLR